MRTRRIDHAGAWASVVAAAVGLPAAAHAQTYAWNGSVNNAWTHAGNWDPSGPPASGANVTIGPGFPQIWCGSSQTLGIISSQSPLHVTGSAWTISGQGVFDGLILQVTTLNADGEVLLNGFNAWVTGAVQGAGGLKNLEGATLALTGTAGGSRIVRGSTLINDAQVSQDKPLYVEQGGRIVNNGAWNADAHVVTAGSGGGTFENSGNLNLTGAATISAEFECHGGTVKAETDGGVLTLNGGGELHGGVFTAEPGATITFLNGASGFEVDGGIAFAGQGTVKVGGSGTFHVTQSGGLTANIDGSAPDTPGMFVLETGELLADGPVTNAGAMEWRSGTIRATGPDGAGLTNNGTLMLRGGNLRTKLTNTSAISQYGTIVIREGGAAQTTAGSSWTLGTGNIAGISGVPAQLVHAGGLYKVGGGASSISVGLAMKPGSSITAYWGTLALLPSSGQSSVEGAATITSHPTGHFRWANGLAVEIKPAAALEFTGAGPITLGAATVLTGAGSTITLNCQDTDDGVLLDGTQILGMGSVHNRGLAAWLYGEIAAGGAEGFVNHAELWMTGTGTRLVGGDMRNTGVVNQLAGAVEIAPNTIVLNENTWTLSGSASIRGDGRMVVSPSGALDMHAPESSTISAAIDNQGAVNVRNGSLLLTGPVEQLSGSTLTGGRWEVSPGATLSTNGRPVKKLAGAAVVKHGTWAELVLEENAGTLDVPGQIDLHGAPFQNNGPLRLTPVPGENPPQIDAPGGIENILGEIDEVFVPSGPGPRGGGGIVTSLLHNSAGVILPGRRGQAGPLRLTGDFLQTGGTLEIDLGGNVPFMMHDQLAVDGDVTLGGTLKVTLLGGFTPAAGASFHIISATGAVAGQFDTLDLPSPGPGLSWRVDTGTGGVTLVVESACTADFNGDGSLSVADFTAFRSAYLAGDMRADLSGDGALNVADFTAFRNAYLAGCL